MFERTDVDTDAFLQDLRRTVSDALSFRNISTLHHSSAFDAYQSAGRFVRH